MMLECWMVLVLDCCWISDPEDIDMIVVGDSGENRVKVANAN